MKRTFCAGPKYRLHLFAILRARIRSRNTLPYCIYAVVHLRCAMETYAALVAHGCAGGHVEWTARERRARALLCGKTERHVQPPAKKWPGVAFSPGYASRSVFGSRVPGVEAMLGQQTHAPAHAAYVERECWADAAAAALRRKRLHARVPLPVDADARIRAALAAPDAVAATDRKSTRLNSSHEVPSRMPSSA